MQPHQKGIILHGARAPCGRVSVCTQGGCMCASLARAHSLSLWQSGPVLAAALKKHGQYSNFLERASRPISPTPTKRKRRAHTTTRLHVVYARPPSIAPVSAESLARLTHARGVPFRLRSLCVCARVCLCLSVSLAYGCSAHSLCVCARVCLCLSVTLAYGCSVHSLCALSVRSAHRPGPVGKSAGR
jgi:hypothetical protein